MVIVEICCSSKASFNNAIKGGASRLELCENLRDDGLTPSNAFLKKVLKIASIPTHILIRPRAGNFVYNVQEVNTIAAQIEMAKSMGVKGVVIGTLNKDNSLPIKVLKYMVKLAKPLDLTFHRAFDKVIQPKDSLKKIIDLGFDRILTSGQESTANSGFKLLIELQKIADDQLVIMPGGGINDQNCNLFFQAGFKEIHLSAKGSEKTADGEPVSDLTTIEKVVLSASKFKKNF
ncbi:MAG: copper homeostasis protein CutC [Flavobacteriaceae bacterium]|nr:copper homeostasis protein CutC [Flavobacteriaceae bacterium]